MHVGIINGDDKLSERKKEIKTFLKGGQRVEKCRNTKTLQKSKEMWSKIWK